MAGMTKYLYALMLAWFILRFALNAKLIHWIAEVPLEQNVEDL